MFRMEDDHDDQIRMLGKIAECNYGIFAMNEI